MILDTSEKECRKLSKSFTGKKTEIISVSANRFPSFSAFGFAYGGPIFNENEEYRIKVFVKPIGRIHQTALERK